MTAPKLAALVMAGGLGTRMRSAVPKHLHPLLGRRMVDWVVEAARPLGLERLVVVASPDTAAAFEGVEVAVQERPLGTGDAARSARAALDAVGDEVLVLSGDTPLLTSELLQSVLEAHRASGAGATVLSFFPDDLRSYGRILRDGEGRLRAIVEAADATEAELAVLEANTSIYVFDAPLLWPALERLEPANSQGELYLTDVVRDLVAGGREVAVHVAPDRTSPGSSTGLSFPSTRVPTSTSRGAQGSSSHATSDGNAPVRTIGAGPGAGSKPTTVTPPAPTARRTATGRPSAARSRTRSPS